MVVEVGVGERGKVALLKSNQKYLTLILLMKKKRGMSKNL